MSFRKLNLHLLVVFLSKVLEIVAALMSAFLIEGSMALYCVMGVPSYHGCWPSLLFVSPAVLQCEFTSPHIIFSLFKLSLPVSEVCCEDEMRQLQ